MLARPSNWVSMSANPVFPFGVKASSMRRGCPKSFFKTTKDAVTVLTPLQPRPHKALSGLGTEDANLRRHRHMARQFSPLDRRGLKLVCRRLSFSPPQQFAIFDQQEKFACRLQVYLRHGLASEPTPLSRLAEKRLLCVHETSRLTSGTRQSGCLRSVR